MPAENVYVSSNTRHDGNYYTEPIEGRMCHSHRYSTAGEPLYAEPNSVLPLPPPPEIPPKVLQKPTITSKSPTGVIHPTIPPPSPPTPPAKSPRLNLVNLSSNVDVANHTYSVTGYSGIQSLDPAATPLLTPSLGSVDEPHANGRLVNSLYLTSTDTVKYSENNDRITQSKKKASTGRGSKPSNPLYIDTGLQSSVCLRAQTQLRNSQKHPKESEHPTDSPFGIILRKYNPSSDGDSDLMTAADLVSSAGDSTGEADMVPGPSITSRINSLYASVTDTDSVQSQCQRKNTNPLYSVRSESESEPCE